MPNPLLHAYHALLIASVIASGIFPRVASPASPTTLPVGQFSEFTFVAVGDLLGPYQSNLRLDDPSFARVVSIIRGADAAFANEEGSTFDLATFAGWLDVDSHFATLHSLATTRAFKEMGFDLFSRANNHARNWGAEGVLASDRALDAIGIIHAGTGSSLEAARAPAYFQSAKGRVALIASASTIITPESAASDSGRGARPRPGVNPLRISNVTLVTPEEMSTLRQIERRTHWEGSPSAPDELSLGAEVGLGGETYRVSDRPGLTYDVSKKDRSDIINSIAMARRSANFVVYSLHAHETRSGGDPDDPEPADFLIPFFHDIVDAGANVVVRSGPHIVMGVEIYHGKPIFYGLGNFFWDLPMTWIVPVEGWGDATVQYPAEYCESAIASSEFRNGLLRKITIYPLVIEPPATSCYLWCTPEAQELSAEHGIPKLAQGADAHRILERIQQRSALFGTKLEIVNGVGIIKGPSVR